MVKSLGSMSKKELIEEINLLKKRIFTLEYEKGVWIKIHQEGGEHEFRIRNLEKSLFEDHCGICWEWVSCMDSTSGNKKVKKLSTKVTPCPLCAWMVMQEKIEESGEADHDEGV